MKLNIQRIFLFIGLMTFGVGVAGILASGLINYNIERLSASVFNLILGAFLIVVTVLVKEET